MFRILKGLLFLGFVSVMTVLFVVCGLTISDVFAGILGFVPTGWSLLLVRTSILLLHPKNYDLLHQINLLPSANSILCTSAHQIGQACRPLVRRLGFWDSIKELGRTYEFTMGIVLFLPIVVLSWFPFVSEFQTRFLFNQAFSRGLQISRILAGRKESDTNLS